MSCPPVTLRSERFYSSFEASELEGLRSTLAQCRTTYASTQARKDGKYYGVTSEWMSSTLQYWHESFDWSKREKIINSVDHYMTTIEDDKCGPFQVHYIAHISPDPSAIPLLLLHGWPFFALEQGSAHEFTKAIKILTQPSSASAGPSFSIICLNQPGYGWSSSPPLDRSFGMHDVARICHSLMLGPGVLRCTKRRNGFRWDGGRTPRERDNASKALNFAMTGRGYGTMHGTRPATIGIIVQASPTALLAWLGENLLEWTEEDLELDHLLDTVTMWWLLGTFPKSMYAYAELTTGVGGWYRDPKLYVQQPFGFLSFGHEIASAPEAWAKQTGRLEFYRYHEKGGHFAAMERPEEFAQDMRDCFGILWHLEQ